MNPSTPVIHLVPNESRIKELPRSPILINNSRTLRTICITSLLNWLSLRTVYPPGLISRTSWLLSCYYTLDINTLLLAWTVTTNLFTHLTESLNLLDLVTLDLIAATALYPSLIGSGLDRSTYTLRAYHLLYQTFHLHSLHSRVLGVMLNPVRSWNRSRVWHYLYTLLLFTNNFLPI